jgi:hypothetical protein
VVEARDEWAKIRTSGDEVGWLKRGTLLEAEGAQVATVVVAADVFERPDLLAAAAGRRVTPGSLLLVVRQRPPFAEVNVGPGPDAWVLADRLVTADREVSVAKLCEKARWLKRLGKEEDARALLALARSGFEGSPLLDVLAQDLGESTGAAGPSGPSGGAPAPPPRSP